MEMNDMIYDMQMTMSYKLTGGWFLWEKFPIDTNGKFFLALLCVIALALVTELLTYFITSMT